MTVVTVHLANIGHRRFEGPESGLRAMHWAEEQRRLRDPEILQRPPTMDKKLWDAIQGEAADTILQALTNAGRASTSTLCDITGYARPTVSRVLHAYAQLGQVRDLGQPNGRAPKDWEIVEPMRIDLTQERT